MSRRCILCLLLLPGIAVCTFGTPAQSCSDRLPIALRQQLHTRFPSWRPKQVSDSQAHDQQLWRKAHSRECPGVATGHFQVSDKFSYAILLVPYSDNSVGYKLVLATDSDSQYQITILDRNDKQNADGMVISSAPPGTYSDFEQTQSIQVRLDSINVEWIEKGAVLYHWTGRRWRKLQTSD
jgi:hypothetical protein